MEWLEHAILHPAALVRAGLAVDAVRRRAVEDVSGSGPLRELTRNRKVDAALQNERLLAEGMNRVQRQTLSLHARLTRAEQHLAALNTGGMRGFWGRVRWLLTGR